MRDHFKELFEYNHHYNQRLAEEILASEDKLPNRSIEIFNHILSAHHIWNSRIRGQQPSYSVWAMHPLSRLKAIDRENFDASLEITGNADFETVVEYATSQGLPFSNTVKDILFHVINHSTYHRGQLALLFRQSGIAPEISDFIFYKRS